MQRRTSTGSHASARRALAALAVVAAIGGCSTPPAPPTRTPAPSNGPSLAAGGPTIPAARWVPSGGATLVGPGVPGGALVLLGGRRALVAADGSVKAETA